MGASITKRYLHLVVLLCAVLFLTACAEKRPEEVAELFWTAVIDNDANRAAKYSTLAGPREFDGFGRNWGGYHAAWGKIVLEGDEATVATTLTKTTSTGDDSLSFETIMIRQDGRWKVDYTRTAQQVNRGPLGRLFGQLEQMGKSLSAQLGASSDELAKEMERIGQQLNALSATLGEQAADIIDQYGESLRKSIASMAESARRALEEQEKRLSDSDRQKLREVANDLEQESDDLSDPSLDEITDSSKNVAAAQRKLDTIDNEAVSPYKAQWQQWSRQFEADMQKLLNEVSAQAER